jgi:hypothetical protein
MHAHIDSAVVVDDESVVIVAQVDYHLMRCSQLQLCNLVVCCKINEMFKNKSVISTFFVAPPLVYPSVSEFRLCVRDNYINLLVVYRKTITTPVKS